MPHTPKVPAIPHTDSFHGDGCAEQHLHLLSLSPQGTIQGKRIPTYRSTDDSNGTLIGPTKPTRFAGFELAPTQRQSLSAAQSRGSWHYTAAQQYNSKMVNLLHSHFRLSKNAAEILKIATFFIIPTQLDASCSVLSHWFSAHWNASAATA